MGYIYIHVSLNVYMYSYFYIIYISFTRTVTYDGNRLFPLWSKSCTPYIKLHFRPTASLSCSLAFKFPRASCKASVAGTLCILGGHFCAVSWHSHGNNVLWQMCVLHAMLKKTCKIGRLAFRESAVCTQRMNLQSSSPNLTGVLAYLGRLLVLFLFVSSVAFCL